MAELTLEQRRAVALAQARLRLQEEEAAPGTEGRGGGMLPFLNRGIATIAGAPVDLANAALGAVGLPTSQQPILGSRQIEAMLARFGGATGATMVPPVGAQPETAGEYIGRGIGEAAGALIPGYGIARMAAGAANPVVAGIGQRVAAAPVAAPVATTGMELAAGAGAGAGRMFAERTFPDTPGAGTLGELAGGLGVASLAAIPGLVAQSPTMRAVQRAVTPFTQGGAEARAGGRLAELVPDPETAARLATAPSIGNLTPAQRTGDPRLMALERSVADADPVIAERLRNRADDSQAALLEAARGVAPGDPARTRTFLEQTRADFEAQLADMTRRAQERANERIRALEPGTPAEEAARIVRDEFEAAYQAAMAQERALWQAIPQDVQIDTAPLFRRFAELTAATPRTQQHDIPDYAREFLSPDGNRRLGPTESPAELQGLRAELLDVARRAQAAGERNRARLARELADATLDAMNSLPETAGPYAAARDFTRTLNQTFRDGEIGALTRTTPDGQPRVPPEMTLQATVGRGGIPGALANRELREATQNSPLVETAVQDYVRRMLRDSAVTSEGRLRPEQVESMLRRNEPLLEQFPTLRQQIAEAVTAQTSAERVAARAERIGRNLRSPKMSAVARYLEADHGNEVARVFAAPNPEAAAASLRRSVARDPSGQALAGLQSAFVDELIGRARQVTPDGAVIRGSVILDALADQRQAKALAAIFTPEQIGRLRQIGNELNALERARGRLPSVGAPMDDMPNRVIELVGRIAAARTGAAVGGQGMAGSLQSAQIMSGRMRDFMRRITNDRASVLLSEAVTDPQLFAALMQPSRSFADQDLAARRIQAWMAGPAGRAAGFGEEEEAEPRERLNRALIQ